MVPGLVRSAILLGPSLIRRGLTHGANRVIRGGSWYTAPGSRVRRTGTAITPGYRNNYLGFRLALPPGQ